MSVCLVVEREREREIICKHIKVYCFFLWGAGGGEYIIKRTLSLLSGYLTVYVYIMVFPSVLSLKICSLSIILGSASFFKIFNYSCVVYGTGILFDLIIFLFF